MPCCCLSRTRKYMAVNRKHRPAASQPDSREVSLLEICSYWMLIHDTGFVRTVLDADPGHLIGA
eukprot:4000075-Pyramimonas_sp.AAC.1